MKALWRGFMLGASVHTPDGRKALETLGHDKQSNANARPSGWLREAGRTHQYPPSPPDSCCFIYQDNTAGTRIE